ncbi:MAG: hypothetical protein LKK07_08340 [Lactococcus lactis]|jgi:hypothetical protein|nr:hypothetical protein [Lactococcus lactis]MCI2139927.1 hypothetical protein [Lactococcus lactis]
MNKEIKDSFLEGILEASKDFAKDKIKENVPSLIQNGTLQIGTEILGGAMVDTIPVVGRILTNYYTKKQLHNTEVLLSELSKRVEEIEENLSSKTDDEKVALNDLMGYVYEKASQTIQDEKISYMLDGYINLTKIENVSADITYIYYDTLDQLTILDLSVLKFFFKKQVYFENIDGYDNYTELMKDFGIEDHQFQAVEKNLYRMSLLEDGGEDDTDKYFKNSMKQMNDNFKLLNSYASKGDARLLRNIKEVKPYRTREHLRISQFGRDFVRFFVKIQ